MQSAKRNPKKSKRSRQARRRDAAARLAEGLPKERLAFLDDIKARVAKGFYNTEPVLDDLSYAFTKAVDALV
jgi:hypothetical protein